MVVCFHSGWPRTTFEAPTAQDQYVFLPEDETKRILQAAFASNDPQAQGFAEEAQDLLLKQGRFEYKQLV